MPTVSIRPYTPSDYQQISRIHDAARKIELSLADLEDAFLPFSVAAEREDFFDYPHIDVAVLDDLVVGFCAYTDEELAWLYVSPDKLRQKIGSALVEGALRTEPGICEIEVLRGNEPAKQLYEKYGFQLDRIVKGVMPGNASFPVQVYSMHRSVCQSGAFLETDRLILRNLEQSDLDTIFEYRNNPLCNRYQRWDAFTKADIRSFIMNYKEDVFLSPKGEQHFAIGSKDTARWVGELACFHSPDCITLGMTVSHPHHRKGYAYEMLHAVIPAIRARYTQLDIVALIEKENTSSFGLFEKLGFRRECYARSISSYVYVLDGN